MFTHLRATRSLCFAGAILTISGLGIGFTAGTSLAGNTNPVVPGTVAPADNTPYSTLGKPCDPQRDGYHFIMNGLQYPDKSVISGNDFGPINITFSNGSTGVALFTDLAGGSVAHFLDSTHNQSGNFEITAASMIFPATTDITGYGNLVISHPPCTTTTTTTTTTIPPTTTTTTVPPTTTTTTTLPPETTTTTTTVPPTTTTTTTTLPPTTTTTTTVPPTTTTTTTLPPETTTTTLAPTTTTAAPTTTTAAPTTTTTTLVLSEVPLPPVTTTSVASLAPTTTVDGNTVVLPRTGSESGRLTILGLALFGLGLTMVALGRRPRRSAS